MSILYLFTKFELDRSTNNGDLLSGEKPGNKQEYTLACAHTPTHTHTHTHTHTNTHTHKHTHTHTHKRAQTETDTVPIYDIESRKKSHQN